MGAHAEFIYRLADLVEYAEMNDLEVASLALNAAVEVIAPSIAREISDKISMPCAARALARPSLRLIQGGLAAPLNPPLASNASDFGSAPAMRGQ